jgi:hypothetical protein
MLSVHFRGRVHVTVSQVPGAEVRACNPRPQEAKTGGSWFEASLGKVTLRSYWGGAWLKWYSTFLASTRSCVQIPVLKKKHQPREQMQGGVQQDSKGDISVLLGTLYPCLYRRMATS